MWGQCGPRSDSKEVQSDPRSTQFNTMIYKLNYAQKYVL